MSIRDWPEDDRPREKLLRVGPAALSEAELLAILLRTGVRGRSAIDVARDLLGEFGSLRALLTADRDRVCAAHGLGPARYVSLQAALELTRRHYQELMTVGSVMVNPRATREYVQLRLRDLPHEVFCCLLLDKHYRVLGFEELFRGTIDGAIVHPREVVKLALSRNAAAVILVHNQYSIAYLIDNAAISASTPASGTQDGTHNHRRLDSHLVPRGYEPIAQVPDSEGVGGSRVDNGNSVVADSNTVTESLIKAARLSVTAEVS